MSDPQVHLSKKAAAALLMCYGKTTVKKGLVHPKAQIDVKLDIFRAPQRVQTNQVDKDGAIKFIEMQDTGPGCDEYDVQAGALTLSKEEANHLKEAYDEILSKDGFPPKWARGILEVENAILSWTAEEAPTE